MAVEVKLVINGQDNASGMLRGVTNALGGLGGIAAGALSVAFGNILTGAMNAAGNAMRAVFTEAIEAQKVTAQLEAVLKSTGGAAGVTKQQALDLADSLSQVSTFSDDAILQGENLLLTFTNIGKDVFPQATQAMLDIGTAMGTDAKGAAIQLGKALNDPTKGVSALTRIGVTFTAQQKKMIATLQASGDIMGAQKIILEELGKEFGGSALAASKTFSGQMEVLKNKLLNVAETIGLSLLPIGQGLIENFIMPALPAIEALAKAFGEKLAGAFNDFTNMLLAGEDPLDAVATLIGDLLPEGLVDDWIGFLNVIDPIIQAVTNLGAAFQASGPQIQGAVQFITASVQEQFSSFGPQIIENMTGALNALTSIWQQHGTTIIAIATIAFQIISATIGTALTIVSGLVSAALQLISGDFSGAGATIQATVAAFMNGILSIVGSNLQSFSASWSGTWSLAGQILQATWTMMQGQATAAVSGLSSAVIEIVVSLVNSIQAAFAIDWGSVGNSIIQGVISGIAGAAGGLAQAASNAATAALQAAQSALGIQSPSKAFMEVGKNMMLGMAQGVNQNSVNPALATQSAAMSAIPSPSTIQGGASQGSSVTVTVGEIHLHDTGNKNPQQLANDFMLEVGKGFSRYKRSAATALGSG